MVSEVKKNKFKNLDISVGIKQITTILKKVGKQEAYRITKKKFLTSIAEYYPELTDEAKRQMEAQREQIMGSSLFRVVRSRGGTICS
jgi:hypothetical protein